MSKDEPNGQNKSSDSSEKPSLPDVPAPEMDRKSLDDAMNELSRRD